MKTITSCKLSLTKLFQFLVLAFSLQLNAQPNNVNPRDLYHGKIKTVFTNVWKQEMNHKDWENQYLDEEISLAFYEDGSKANLEIFDYDSEGNIRSKSAINYKNSKGAILDSLGNPIRRNGPLGIELIQYKYNNGRVIEMIEENENHELQFKTNYYYENGKLISADHFNKEGIKVNQLFYDENERLKEQIHCSNEKQLWIRKLYYDEKGFLVREEEWNLKGKKTSETSFEYEFDNQGNWIKEWKTIGKTRFYSKRAIEYYE